MIRPLVCAGVLLAPIITQGAPCSDARECERIGRESYDRNDRGASRSAFSDGCKFESSWSCLQLGYSHWLWDGVTHDEASALEAFGKACKLGSSQGCEERAWMLTQRGDASSRTEALRLYSAGCDGGRMQSCLLGFQTAWAHGQGREWAHLAPLIRETCLNGGTAACGVYGNALAQGAGMPRDLVRARHFYRRACSVEMSWCERMWLLPGGSIAAWLNAFFAAALAVSAQLVQARLATVLLTGASLVGMLILGFGTYLRTIGGTAEIGPYLPIAFALGSAAVSFAVVRRIRWPWTAPPMTRSAAGEGKDDAKGSEEGQDDGK